MRILPSTGTSAGPLPVQEKGRKNPNQAATQPLGPENPQPLSSLEEQRTSTLRREKAVMTPRAAGRCNWGAVTLEG